MRFLRHKRNSLWLCDTEWLTHPLIHQLSLAFVPKKAHFQETLDKTIFTVNFLPDYMTDINKLLLVLMFCRIQWIKLTFHARRRIAEKHVHNSSATTIKLSISIFLHFQTHKDLAKFQLQPSELTFFLDLYVIIRTHIFWTKNTTHYNHN